MNNQVLILEKNGSQSLLIQQQILYDDLKNFIGMCGDVYGALQKIPSNEPLRIVQFNRLIAQMNLSNSIHFDVAQETQFNKNSLYKETKKQLLDIFDKFASELEKKTSSQAQSSDYQIILSLMKDYRKNLDQSVCLPQNKQIYQINNSGSLNTKSLQKVVDCMNQVGQKYQNIKKSTAPDRNELTQYFNERQKYTQDQLKRFDFKKSINNSFNSERFIQFIFCYVWVRDNKSCEFAKQIKQDFENFVNDLSKQLPKEEELNEFLHHYNEIFSQIDLQLYIEKDQPLKGFMEKIRKTGNGKNLKEIFDQQQKKSQLVEAYKKFSQKFQIDDKTKPIAL